MTENVQQVFGLRIVKQIDKKTGQVHLEVKSQAQGLPFAEAILLVEGWLDAEKRKMLDPVFRDRKDAAPK
ncbi:MAG: hypothetical protein ABIH41_02400 [Nanoarchaeota archaeon]